MNHPRYEIAGDDEIEVRAVWSDAASAIQWRAVGEVSAWHATIFQVADAQHDSQNALTLVHGWLDSQS